VLTQTYLNIHDRALYGGNPASVLVAADDAIVRQALESYLGSWDCETVIVLDDKELLHRLELESHPSLLIIDGAMEAMDTDAVCRHIRLSSHAVRPYIILISHGSDGERSVFDPDSGPDDLLDSPFTKREFHARVSAGMRIIGLERKLSSLVLDLRQAATRIQKLSGLLPICSHCKKIRDDRGYWNEVENYISDHSDAEFSHAICPGCLHKYYPDVNDETR